MIAELININWQNRPELLFSNFLIGQMDLFETAKKMDKLMKGLNGRFEWSQSYGHRQIVHFCRTLEWT